MSIMSKLHELLIDTETECDDDVLEFPEDTITKRSKKYKINPGEITLEEAIDIANQNENLKTSFNKYYIKEHNQKCSYLYFCDFKEKIIIKNNRRAWKLKVIDGEISHIIYDEATDSTTYVDGLIEERKDDQLTCLIYMDNGEYEYLGE